MPCGLRPDACNSMCFPRTCKYKKMAQAESGGLLLQVPTPDLLLKKKKGLFFLFARMCTMASGRHQLQFCQQRL